MTASRILQTKIVALIGLVACIQAQQCLETPFEAPLEQPFLEQVLLPTPGLSGSFDYSDFDKIKKPLTQNILKIINNMKVPDIEITDGYLNQNKLYIEKTTDLTFQALNKENALLFQLKNLKARLRVNDFYYSGILIPVRGYLDITMAGVLLRVKAQFKKILQNGRLLPQIEIIECTFQIDTSQMKFDFGGGFMLAIADFIIPVIKGFFRGPIERMVYDQIKNGLPQTFNKFVKTSQGYYNLGDNLPGAFPKTSPYSSITLDYQLDDDLRVLDQRLEFGINGTFFNRDRGYTVPPGLKQPMMPFKDPNLPAKYQLFLSNYLLETVAAAFLEKNPVVVELLAAKLANPIAAFETNTFEGVFPFLTSRFGKNVPTDLILKIKKIYDINAYSEDSDEIPIENDKIKTGMLSLSIDIDAEIRLNYPGGVNKSVGHAEWQQTVVKVHIQQTNGPVFNISMYSGNITKQFVDTIYIGRFQSSPWVINTALKFILDFVNESLLSTVKIDLNDYTKELFKLNDTNLGYHDGYLSFGWSIDLSNSTIPKLKQAGIQQLADYIERHTINEVTGLPPVEPHQIAMMEETERKYQEHIRQNQEIFEAEQLKHKAVLKKYPLLMTNGIDEQTPSF